MGCEIFLDEPITKISQLVEGKEYVFDNELYQLIEIKDNRFVFVTMYGTYVANKAMMEQHIKYGVKPVREPVL